MSLQIIVIVVYLAVVEALLVRRLLVRDHVCELSFIRHTGVVRKISKCVLGAGDDETRGRGKGKAI